MFDRYENRPAFTVTGRSIETSQVDGAAFRAIPEFWASCHTEGLGAALDALAPEKPFLGVCYGMDTSGTFRYMIAKEAPATAPYESLQIPAATWAVFVSRGPMPEAIQTVWQKEVGPFLSRSDITVLGYPDLEVYPCGDTTADDFGDRHPKRCPGGSAWSIRYDDRGGAQAD